MLTKERQSFSPALPADVPNLQTMVLGLHEKMAEMEKNYELENRLLREQIRQLQHQLYGRKSEKVVQDDDFRQNSLFNESNEFETPPEPTSVEEITIPSHQRKKRGRKRLPESLRRIEVVHDIAEEEKRCGCGGEMSRIGEEVSEQLEMVPARFWVVRHIRPKYACKCCEGVERNEGDSTVKIAPAPLQLLAKSISTPGLLSHILVGKFCDSLPFSRQEQQFKRLGFELTRSTMVNWSLRVAMKCAPLVELLRQEILCGPLINIDETPFQVLHEPGRRVESKSYMWLFRGGPPGKESVIYYYSERRSGVVALDFLGDYQGYVQTDGYSGYDFLDHRQGIIHIGCWAHVRRKFLDVVKAADAKSHEKGLGKAGEALKIIGELYRIEKNARHMKLTPEALYEERQKSSKPLLEKFESWLKELAPTAPPKSLLGKALNYTENQWPRLINYLVDGNISMDNNLAENAIRPFVVGRKNWLFFEQQGGAQAGAILYSLIETAKINQLEPYKYFCYIFDKLPLILKEDNMETMKTLLPQNITQDVLDQHQKEYLKRGAV